MLIGIFQIPFMATKEEDQNETSLQTSAPAVFSAQEGFCHWSWNSAMTSLISSTADVQRLLNALQISSSSLQSIMFLQRASVDT